MMGKWLWSLLLLIIVLLLLAGITAQQLQPLPSSLQMLSQDGAQPQLLDRHGVALNISYQQRWNYHAQRPLYDIPLLLQQAFVEAEDRRFFTHHGVDWQARLHAVWQNLLAGHAVRGASTISEQVVRMLHPRPRTIWSRWLEGFEARRLEQSFSKNEILEFYLNQVPYARQWRGVAQAARGYFGRDLETLSTRETLVLAVLVRAPGAMDLFQHPQHSASSVQRLASRMLQVGQIDASQWEQCNQPHDWDLLPAQLPVSAPHFVRYVRQQFAASSPDAAVHQPQYIHTTLDASLQQRLQAIMDQRLQTLRQRNVHQAAAVIIDHQRNEILAWVNAGGSDWDGVITPRQPGSTLKPFLYALALEKGWTAASLINDAPLAQAVGAGVHHFHNYSHHYYGELRLRDALGNSLNIPAVRAVNHVGVQPFLEKLHALGFHSLQQRSDFYGEGLVLGNGEVTLLELAQAYATLARGGRWQPLRLYDEQFLAQAPKQVLNDDVSTIISSVLSDHGARSLEFGRSNLFHFPMQAAVKTGTSSDYRDAWAVSFSHRYVVAIWMGNLDRQAMHEVTGSSGPGVALRSIFGELMRYDRPQPLRISPHLKRVSICRITGKKARKDCPAMDEWFRPQYAPKQFCPLHGAPATAPTHHQVSPHVVMLMPTEGLQMARDPRIPDALELFPMQLKSSQTPIKVDWYVDEQAVASTNNAELRYLWPLREGVHHAYAKVWLNPNTAMTTKAVNFVVK